MFEIYQNIRVGLTPEGNIEASGRLIINPAIWVSLVVDVRTGSVLHADVKEGSDMFRRLVRAARQYVAQ